MSRLLFKNGKEYRLVKNIVKVNKKRYILLKFRRFLLFDYYKHKVDIRNKTILDTFYKRRKVNTKNVIVTNYKSLGFFDQLVGFIGLNYHNFDKLNESEWLKDYGIKFFFSNKKFLKLKKKYKFKKFFIRKKRYKFVLNFEFWQEHKTKELNNLVLIYLFLRLFLNDINYFFEVLKNKNLKRLNFIFLKGYYLKYFFKYFKKFCKIENEKLTNLMNIFFLMDLKKYNCYDKFIYFQESKSLVRKRRILFEIFNEFLKKNSLKILSFIRIVFKK